MFRVQEVEIVNVLISKHFTLQLCQLGSMRMLCLGRECTYKQAGGCQNALGKIKRV